jgi:SAM-dependent methyltransferase
LKRYDQEYYDHWYRSRAAVITAESRLRKVRLALAAAEFALGRDIRSVLDVGCGEAAWRAVLRRMRPELLYVGVDSSEYVVQRFGAKRNIRLGSFGTLGELQLRGKFDLIVCADVIAYVNNADLARGLAAIRKLLRGVAYLEAYAIGDDMVGDFDGWHHRSEVMYRKAFAKAGLIACGMHCWVTREQRHLLAAMERCG